MIGALVTDGSDAGPPAARSALAGQGALLEPVAPNVGRILRFRQRALTVAKG